MQDGTNPLDTPFAAEVMRITKVTHGWVINAMGETWACETPASLSRRVREWAIGVETQAQAFLEPKSTPAPNGTTLAEFTHEWPASQYGSVGPLTEENATLINRTVFPEPMELRNGDTMVTETTFRVTQSELSEDEQLAIQRDNLVLLIEALFDNQIDEVAFSRGTAMNCPDLSGEEICAALDGQHDAYNAGHTDPELVDRHRRIRSSILNQVPLVRVPSPSEDSDGEAVDGVGTAEPDDAPHGDAPLLRPVGETERPELGSTPVDAGVVGEGDRGDHAEPGSRPSMERPNSNQQRGVMRPVTRRPLLQPGTWRDPRPEDIDKYDE